MGRIPLVLGMFIILLMPVYASAQSSDRISILDTFGDYQRGESGLALLEQRFFAQGLVFRIIRQRIQRQVFRDVRLVFDSVHAGGRSVHKAVDAVFFRDVHQIKKTIVVDRLSQFRIQLEAGIV